MKILRVENSDSVRGILVKEPAEHLLNEETIKDAHVRVQLVQQTTNLVLLVAFHAPKVHRWMLATHLLRGLLRTGVDNLGGESVLHHRAH
eukprot:653944-Hanusia_phi.AAC.3